MLSIWRNKSLVRKKLYVSYQRTSHRCSEPYCHVHQNFSASEDGGSVPLRRHCTPSFVIELPNRLRQVLHVVAKFDARKLPSGFIKVGWLTAMATKIDKRLDRPSAL